jgi:predicted PurR-regulated permease PerM
MDRILLKTLTAYSAALLFCYLLYTILSPFLAVLVWAGAVGVITYPLYARLLVRCNGRDITAATLMTTAVVLALIVPLVGLIFTLSREVALVYQYLEQTSTGTAGLVPHRILSHPALAPVLERLRPLIGTFELDLESMILPAFKKVLAAMLNYSTGIVKDFFQFLFKLILMLITLFFMYKDGPRALQAFWQVVPVDGKLRDTIKDTVTRVLGAVVYGVIMTCMVQGALGGLGFWVAGLPSPLLFGTLMAICASIPLVGTALIWLPGAAYLLVQGQTLPGILLIVWGALAVGGIDNVLRPLFISGKAKLPILVIVFGVLGGFLAFGLSGVVAGPVILALALVFFDTCRAETADADSAPQSGEGDQ